MLLRSALVLWMVVQLTSAQNGEADNGPLPDLPAVEVVEGEPLENETTLAVEPVGDGVVVATVVADDDMTDDAEDMEDELCAQCDAQDVLQEDVGVEGDYEDDDGNALYFGLNVAALELTEADLTRLRDTLMHDNDTKRRDESAYASYSPESYVFPLLEKVQYDKNAPPKLFSDIPVEVRVGIRVNQISDFDVRALKYTSEVEVVLKWRDPRLKNNFRQPILLTTEDIIDSVWRPDPFFPMSKLTERMLDALDDDKKLPPSRKMLVQGNGVVSYLFRVNLIISCPMVFCRYPHDKQQCVMQMASSWSIGLRRPRSAC